MTEELPRVGPRIMLNSGRWFWPLDPRVEDIDIDDIAKALSRICRFGGHCDSFYSVGQHAVHVAQATPAPHKLWGLLHDAAEAYIGDTVKPIKDLIGWQVGNRPVEPAMWRSTASVEDAILKVIGERFNLSWPPPKAVHKADMEVLKAECRDLMPKDTLDGHLSEYTAWVSIRPYPCGDAELMFKTMFYSLTQKRD